MKIETWQQCHELPEGQLVVDAEGEIWRVTRYEQLPGETWLSCFSDEYATVISSEGGVHIDAETAKLPLEVVQVTPGPYQALVALGLTEDERRVLAAKATYQANDQDDFRYQCPDPVERARLKARWQEIADALHPDPWGTAKTRPSPMAIVATMCGSCGENQQIAGDGRGFVPHSNRAGEPCKGEES